MGGPREGGDFQNLHRNKRSMTLNLKAPEGLAAFKRMVKKADVVVENFSPRVIEQFDLGWDVVRRLNPRLVMVRMPAFGLDGRRHARRHIDRNQGRPDHALQRPGFGVRRARQG